MARGRSSSRRKRKNVDRPQCMRETSKSVVNDSDLPDEVLFQIFVHLPTKAVYRYRCVSRRWRSLISDTKLVELFLSNSNSDCKSIQRPFSILLIEKVTSLYLPKVHRFDDSETKLDHEFCIGFIIPDGDFHFKGHIRVLASYNDLILCLNLGVSEIILCNFFTKQWISLPRTQTGQSAFGLLPDRVVCINNPPCIYGDEGHSVKGGVLEFRIGEWCHELHLWCELKIEFPCNNHQGLACNGKLYWMTKPKNKYCGVLVYDPLRNGGNGELSLIESPMSIEIDDHHDGGDRYLVRKRESFWSIGLCQGKLMITNVQRNKGYSPSLPVLDELVLLLWELEDNHTHDHDDEKINENWCLKRKVSLLDFVFEDGTSLRDNHMYEKQEKNRVLVRCFHPYDRDIIYFQFQDKILLCNLQQGTLQYTQTPGKLKSGQLFVIPHPWCPTPLPELSIPIQNPLYYYNYY